MMLMKWIFAGLALLPIAEFAAFAGVASQIGLLRAFLLMIALSFAGLALLRYLGFAALRRLRTDMMADGTRMIRLEGSGILLALGALLLAIPGYLTDAMGLALLAVALWNRAAAALGRGGEPPMPGRRGPSTVDLQPDEWERRPDPHLPPPRRPPDGR